MNKKEIIKILKLLKKDKKKRKAKKLKDKGLKKPYVNISNLTPSTISQMKYQPDFHIPIFKDYNRIESENFSEYKKSRGLLPTENRGILPSDYELLNEYEKVKKLSKGEINDLLTNKNIKSQALERQKYLDKLQIDEEKRRIKEQELLLKQKTKTQGKIKKLNQTSTPNKVQVGTRPPIELENLIFENMNSFSPDDSNGLETAIGGSSDEFITQESELPSQVEAPSIISVGGGTKPKVKQVGVGRGKYVRPSKLN